MPCKSPPAPLNKKIKNKQGFRLHWRAKLEHYPAPLRAAGFTLIELSIVIVIIGLLVGGVLVGRDLVRAAQIRSVISEVNQIKTAVFTFRSKYNCLPGDCKNAATLFTGATNGNGDRRIGAFPGVDYSEVWGVWLQLGQAGLVPGTYTGAAGVNSARHAVPGTNVMASRTRSDIGYTLLYWPGFDNLTYYYNPSVYSAVNENIMLVGTTGNGETACCGFNSQPDNFETYAPAFTAGDAYAIDSKMDDGLPASGIVSHFNAGIYAGCVTSQNPATATYDIASGIEACALFIKAGI